MASRPGGGFHSFLSDSSSNWQYITRWIDPELVETYSITRKLFNGRGFFNHQEDAWWPRLFITRQLFKSRDFLDDQEDAWWPRLFLSPASCLTTETFPIIRFNPWSFDPVCVAISRGFAGLRKNANKLWHHAIMPTLRCISRGFPSEA